MQEYDNIFKRYKNYHLFYIAKYENTEKFLRELYLHPHLINQKNSKGENLSHLLSYEGMTEKYYPFLEMGGTDILTNDNNSSLHYCISSGSDTFLMIDLIKNGSDPLLKNINGQTPIHLISSLQTASYFTNWNFRTFSKIDKLFDNEGNSIAHSVAINKRKDIVDFLITEYPNLKKLKNNLSLTPEQLVFLSHQKDFQHILEDVQFYKLFLPFLSSYFNGLDSKTPNKSKILTKPISINRLFQNLPNIISTESLNVSNIFLFNLHNTSSHNYDCIEFYFNLQIKNHLILVSLLDQNNNVYSSYIYNQTSDSFLNNTSEFPLISFIPIRKNFTKFDKIKPLSISELKKEIKTVFSNSNIIQNEVTEIYKKELMDRRDTNNHDFHFDFSKKF